MIVPATTNLAVTESSVSHADLELAGLAYIDNQAAKYAEFVIAQWGGFQPGVDVQDVAQETHTLLAEALGDDYAVKIGTALESSGFAESSECQAVNRCKWRAADGLRKGKKLSQSLAGLEASVIDRSPGPEKQAELVSLADKLNVALEKFPVQELQILELKRTGMTLREIGTELNIPFQRVGDTLQKITKTLVALLKE